MCLIGPILIENQEHSHTRALEFYSEHSQDLGKISLHLHYYILCTFIIYYRQILSDIILFITGPDSPNF